MKKIKASKLTIIAYSSLAVAILSAFTTIVSYRNRFGDRRTFNLIDLLFDASGFGDFVFSEYRGRAIAHFQTYQVFVLIALGVAAIACSLIGLIKLSNQTENNTSFVLTLSGLLITMIPSLVMFICIVALGNNYDGYISCGIYPIVSPISMAICIAAATKMRRRNIEYRKKRESRMKMQASNGMIRKGDDL